MAIFITGDTHGDFTRLRRLFFPAQSDMTKQDYVIICGDFGGVWDDGPEDRYWLDWLEEKPFATLFIDGNHDNFDLLAAYPIEPWQGGMVQRVRPSVIHLMRGQVYQLQGLSFFTMGGARSHDISGGILDPDDPLFREAHRQLTLQGRPHRINHVTWWKEELPREEEYQTARDNLALHGWKVDCVITHCCPTSVQAGLCQGRYPANPLTDFLEELSQRCQFKRWFFGHYHLDQVVSGRCLAVHEEIIPLK